MDEQKRPLISIIVPVYNVEKYLPACLDGLLAQTYPNFELICVNDGSSDDSQSILEQYAQKDSRVRVFQKENGGVSSARNFGLEQAMGDYIGFVDPDDLVAPQYLEQLLDAIRRLKASMAVCSEWKIAEQDVPSCYEKITDVSILDVKLSEASYEKKNIKRSCWGALYSRELVNNLRFDSSLSIGEDTLFFLNAFQKAGHLAWIQSQLYLYVQRENSAYRSAYSPKQYTEFLAWKKIVGETASLGGPLHDSAEYELMMTSVRLYYKMLDSDYRDTQKEKELTEEMRRYKKRVYAIRPSAGWEAWAKAKMLSMLYLPAGVNRGLWGKLEQLRARKSGEKSS